MATTQTNLQPDKKPGGFFGFLKTSYRVSMDASENMTHTAIDLPFNILEGMGVPEDKTQGFKNFNHKFVGGVYRGMDKATSTLAGAASAPVKWLETGFHKLMPGGEKPKEMMEAAVEEAKPAMAKAMPKTKTKSTKRKLKAKAKVKAKAAKPKRKAMTAKAKAAK